MRAELLLADLGSTAEQVAETLKLHQAFGYQLSGKICPVAVYLTKATTAADVSVGFNYVFVDGKVTKLPESVRDFIFRFEGGEFGELKLQ